MWNPFKFISNLGREISLETRLLHFFISVEIVWALANAIGSVIIGMPKATIATYFSLFIIVSFHFIMDKLVKREILFAEIYFICALLSIPVVWYFAGGARSSANILFVCELMLFVMCMKGKKQKIYLALSLFSAAFTQGFSNRLPNSAYPMEPWQYQRGGSVLGLTTSLLIASLLIKQKLEYMKERDAAVASEQELERSNSMQKNFLANMSHEIRSPLGIVMGFNNLIGESDDVEQIHEYSKDITQAGTTLLTVINDILDYSKIESGKLDIIEADYSFPGLIEEIKKDIGLKCDEKGLKFATRVDENIPQGLYGDNIRIKQCLLNVLSNAVKYTEKGAVIFTVQRLEDSSGDICSLKYMIKDTGKGISKEAIPNLYSAFQRLDEGANRGIEGTGLGLAITKNLLDEMDGTIEVESEVGKGTTFTIYLKQRVSEGIHEEVSEEMVETLEGIKVLVVDDTALNLTLVRKLLNNEGAQVDTVDNGLQCLKIVKENKYDIILLDHMMPEMDGLEVFKRLQEAGGVNKETPVVMLTANAMAGAAQEYIDMGFDGYISKPILPKELKETIARIVKSY